ncbi:MAG: cohesin domain-containing protein [Acidobacteriota bacterium]
MITQSIVASFTAAKSTPDAMDVTLQKKSVSGDSFTVDVVITDVNGVYSAAFDLVYDGTILDYLNSTEGNFLKKDGASTSFIVDPQTGRLVVGASRLGQVGGVDAVGNEVLMSIAFKVRKTGSTSISFENSSLLDANVTSIQGVEWFGGTASGS